MKLFKIVSSIIKIFDAPSALFRAYVPLSLFPLKLRMTKEVGVIKKSNYIAIYSEIVFFIKVEDNDL